MPIGPEEILNHARGDAGRWLAADGNDVPQHELPEAVESLLLTILANKLAHAMNCAELAEYYFDERHEERAKSQLWNW